MNLDRASAADTDAPLSPPDWTMEVTKVGASYCAEVARAGKVMCRLSAYGTASDEPAVRRQLADKARWWIHDYLGRNG